MSNFPLTKLEVFSSSEEDKYVYEILKKIYDGEISFDYEEFGFKGIVVWKSQRYIGINEKFVTTYEIREY